MTPRYTDEKQALIVIRLLKSHGIRRVIASPGATNINFVGSIQSDPFFTIYSAVDERSAAYMACGLAAETGEPVVISCTGATASRNYLPGLTEAYYRKLPVLAVTSTQIRARIGQHNAQAIDRSTPPRDTLKLSLELPVVKDDDDIWECEIKVNRAILELTRNGGGPAHLNLPTTYSRNFELRQLPDFRVIKRWNTDDLDAGKLPVLNGRVGVFVGSHPTWTKEETAALDRFCEANNAAVFCDHTSGYHGKYRILSALIGAQDSADKSPLRPDVMIHIGEVSGDYEIAPLMAPHVWRVNRDGEIRDSWRRLRHVFEMSELRFFRHYGEGKARPTTYFETLRNVLNEHRANVPELPFSNLWLAARFARHVPSGSVVHFAILNSLRAWNFFDLPEGVRTASNVGGFGIDGCTSSLIGASLANPNQLYFLVTGDLAFFYDMNSLGSRHLSPNVRVLLVNNGKGTEFTQYGHAGSTFAGDVNQFIAADGHYSSKSPDLGMHFAKGLGLDYVRVTAKEDCEVIASRFFSPEPLERPMLIEALVDSQEESDALRIIKNMREDHKTKIRNAAKRVLGPNGIRVAKHLLGR